MTLRTLKLVLAYDGTEFAGWQSQLGHRTVQDELELAIKKVTCESIRVTGSGSGRTDAGVHAIGQVVSFSTASLHTPAVFLKALNAELPDDIAVHSVEQVALQFHAISGYSQTISLCAIRCSRGDVFELRYAWQLPFRLDLSDAQRCPTCCLEHTTFVVFKDLGRTARAVFGLSTMYRFIGPT